MTATYDFSLTRDQIIKGALRLLGVISQGQTPDSTQVTDAAEALNVLVKAWESDGLQLWAIKKTSFPVTATNTYTIGTGQTVNVAKPLKIYQAWMRDTTSNIDTPMYMLSQQQYNILGNKSSVGSPTQMYYECLNDSGNIYIFPLPDSATIANKTCYIQYQAPFADFDSSSDVPDFPQEWLRAIKYGLAAEMAFEYGFPTKDREELTMMAEKYKQDALSLTQENTSIFFQIDRQRM